MLRVGLTGNIASGKSHASLVFKELGAHIIDADAVAHRILSPGTPTHAKVAARFGPAILGGDGTIDRKRLGEIIFHDANRRSELNALVHPDIAAEIARRIAEIEAGGAGGIVIIDAALMVESGSYKRYDKLVVVHCDPALQLARLMARDGLGLEDARARMAAQLPPAEKIKVADYTVDTSGTFRQTRDQIEAIYRDLLLQEIRLRHLGEA